MTNVSWNNSTRADYYSKAYAAELQKVKESVTTHLLGGLKFFSWQDVELLLKLKWHEDSVSQLNCGISLSKKDYKINCHCNDAIPVNRFFYVQNQEESFFENYYEVADIIRTIETNLQLNEGVSVKASNDSEDLGYIPNFNEPYYWAVTPITWEAIKKVPLANRIAKLEEEKYPWDKVCYVLKKSSEEVNLLLYGTNDNFEIQAIKKAKSGDTRAADALSLTY